MAESFFQRLNRARIRRKIYMVREEARRDVFYYIDIFYNLKRRDGYANRISPVEFEKPYFNRPESVQKSRGDPMSERQQCQIMNSRRGF